MRYWYWYCIAHTFAEILKWAHFSPSHFDFDSFHPLVAQSDHKTLHSSLFVYMCVCWRQKMKRQNNDGGNSRADKFWFMRLFHLNKNCRYYYCFTHTHSPTQTHTNTTLIKSWFSSCFMLFIRLFFDAACFVGLYHVDLNDKYLMFPSPSVIHV